MTGAPDTLPRAARAALAAALRQWYPEDTQLALARSVGHTATHGLAEVLLSESRLECVAGGDQVAAAVVALRRMDKPTRGDKLRREAILAGIGDVASGLQSLVTCGLVLMRPIPGGRGSWTVEDAIARRQHLQRELIVPAQVLDLVERWVPDHAQSDELVLRTGHVRRVVEFPMRSFEWSLLHLTSVLSTDVVAINRDGTLGRRTLRRIARDIQVPGRDAPHDLADPEVVEAVGHLVAMSCALGLLEVRDGGLGVAVAACETYFQAPRAERDQRLLKAYSRSDDWSEVGAFAATHGGDETGGWVGSGGMSRLGGARTQILADLANVSVDGWVFVDTLVHLLCALDRGYLEGTLDSILGIGTATPSLFVESVLLVALPWLGLARVGVVSSDGGPSRRVFQLTNRGGQTLGPETPAPTRAPEVPPLVVQPNLEVTAFLDGARLGTLYTLHRIGERIDRQEHSAVFALTAESVQRAYGLGLDARSVLCFLQRNSRTALPDNVEFSLRDWERVQGRVAIYTSGTLIEHFDGERLDVDLGNISHLRGSSDAIVRLDDRCAFVPGDPAPIGGAYGNGGAVVFQYGGAPNRCLVRVGPLTFAAARGGLDVVTENDLVRLTERVDAGDTRQWRLAADFVASAGTPVPEVLSWVRARVVDPLPAEDELRLRAVCGDDLHARVLDGATVVLLSTEELADAVEEIAQVEGWIERRLGPTAMLVEASAASGVRELLRSLGLVRDD